MPAAPASRLLPVTADLVLRFDRFSLHPARRELFLDGQPVAIGSRAFDLLALLARHAGRSLSGQDLRRAVWDDRDVGANNLRVQITHLRKLLGDGAIVHHATLGYRLTLPVTEDDAGAAADPAPSRPGNLPSHLPPLQGRDDDLEALLALLAGHDRVTLTGAAGVGKTSLARTAASIAGAAADTPFVDGAWWIELAALTDGAQIAHAVAAALDLGLAGDDPLAELAHALSDRRLLLALDNAEHLADPVRRLADALLRGAPGVCLLVTSRRTLKCAGEQVLRLAPLALPDEAGLAAARRSGAVALFVARAQRSEPGFALTAANADAVAAICRSLDGVALSIGLAAARVSLLGVVGLHDRLADRLRLLTPRAADPDDRIQSLAAALAWSHDLLSDEERRLLRRLAVFSGSFALEAVQSVAVDESLDEWAVLDAMNALIDHSLLTPEVAMLQASGGARYRLHETVRLFALENLAASGEEPARRERHALQLLAALEPPPGAFHDRMRQTLPDADIDNLRVALAWTSEHRFDLALALAISASPTLRVRGHHTEARRLMQALLRRDDGEGTPARWIALRLALFMLCIEQNDLDEAFEQARLARDDALRRDPEPGQLGFAWACLGSVHWQWQDLDAAEDAWRRALALLREAGRMGDTASQLNHLGLVAMARGRFDEADAFYNEALAIHRGLKWTWGIGVSICNLGESAYARGDVLRAQAYWLDTLATMRELGHLHQEALALMYLGLTARRLGEPDASRARLAESLRLSLAQRMPGLAADALIGYAGLALDAGQPRQAARLLGAVARQRGTAQAVGPVVIDLREIETATRAALSAADWHAARGEGERLAPEQAIAPDYFDEIRSTSNTNVAFGGITPPAPRAP